MANYPLPVVKMHNNRVKLFPMYSEGCGSGTELWQGAYAINKTGLFVRHIAETGRLPYKVTIEGPKGGPPQSSILARFWEPGTSKLPAFQYLYDPNIKKFEKVGELMPNTDAAYSYKDLMKTLAHSSPWVVLPSITGAAAGIFLLGFLAGGVAEFGGERAVRRLRRVRQYRLHEEEVFERAFSLPDMASPLMTGTHSMGDAPQPAPRFRHRQSLLMDFVKGVPDGGGLHRVGPFANLHASLHHGHAQDCDCTVQCEDGFPRIGGGLEGKRKCTPDALSLGPPPVCRAKKAGEPGQPPACPRPQVADASVDCQCKAVAEGCECPIYCTHTHGNIKADAPEGSKKCVIEEKVPPEGVCSEFTNEADCLGCVRLRASPGVCAARYDPKMFFAPTMCSKSLFPKWEEMPECKPRCVPNLLQDCTDCIADQPCPCKVRCNEDGGYERVGGGSEGSRSCSASAPESLYFEEAPLCQLK
eukprot:s2989_g1.t1